jgi:poly(3-hydroxybutyrate) depolymerase
VDYLVEFLQYLGPKNNLLAACQPCPGALAATAVLAMKEDPAQPKTLTLMAGPVNPHVNAPPALKLGDKIPLSFLEKIVIDKVPAAYTGKGRKVYPGFRQLSFFIGMNSTLHIKKYLEFYWNVIRGNDEKADAHRRFYDDYNAVMDATSEAYLDTLKRIFIENQLPNKMLRHRGKKVDFNAIKKTALFTVEGENDQFCPPGQTSAAHEICKKIPKKMRANHFQEGVGHYGVFSGSKYEKHIVPRIKKVIQLAGEGKAIATS